MRLTKIHQKKLVLKKDRLFRLLQGRIPKNTADVNVSRHIVYADHITLTQTAEEAMQAT